MSGTLLYSILAIIAGFGLLVWSADRFVYGASALARNLGVPPLVVGLTILGFGTSAPEIVVSIIAAAQGNPGVAVGNAIGSNIANIGLVLGLTAMICPLTVKSETLRREYPVMFIVMLLSLGLIMDGELSILDGSILLLGLVLLGYWVVNLGLTKKRRDPMEQEFEQEIPRISSLRASVWVFFGLLVLLASSRALVWGAVNIATIAGVSDTVIGLTVVAIGTSLPELAASISGALKKEYDLAIGNVIGSNMFNLLAVLGIPGVIAPHVLEPSVLQRDFPVMIGLSIALFAVSYGFRNDGRITRLEGGALFAAYIVYLGAIYFSAAQ